MSATWQRRQRETPSFVARRQQHRRFTATAAVALPSEPGRSGGIVAFQNETHHFYMGVRREGASGVVFLERAVGAEAGGKAQTVARQSLPDTAAGAGRLVWLRIEGRGRVRRAARAARALIASRRETKSHEKAKDADLARWSWWPKPLNDGLSSGQGRADFVMAAFPYNIIDREVRGVVQVLAVAHAKRRHVRHVVPGRELLCHPHQQARREDLLQRDVDPRHEAVRVRVVFRRAQEERSR